MGENLVIVESPAKAKTIEKFLGAGYTVKSSFGHIRDLSKKNLGIDIPGGFQPDYEISDDKKKIVSELKSLAKKAGTVWLASDEDREGEAIAWHLRESIGGDESHCLAFAGNAFVKRRKHKTHRIPRNHQRRHFKCHSQSPESEHEFSNGPTGQTRAGPLGRIRIVSHFVEKGGAQIIGRPGAVGRASADRGPGKRNHGIQSGAFL